MVAKVPIFFDQTKLTMLYGPQPQDGFKLSFSSEKKPGPLEIQLVLGLGGEENVGETCFDWN